MVRPDYVRFVIYDSSKFAIFYSYKICKQYKWTYSSNLHLSFNIRVNSLVGVFLTKSKDANHHESRIVRPHHKVYHAVIVWSDLYFLYHIRIKNPDYDSLL